MSKVTEARRASWRPRLRTFKKGWVHAGATNHAQHDGKRVFNHRLADGGLELNGRLPTILYHGNVSGANPREMT